MIHFFWGRIHQVKQYYVYIIASRKNGTLYIGVTNNFIRRAYEHREGLVDGFTKRYSVKILVFYEIHTDINVALLREKQLKKWNRAWKIQLIEEMNPDWSDLYETII